MFVLEQFRYALRLFGFDLFGGGIHQVVCFATFLGTTHVCDGVVLNGTAVAHIRLRKRGIDETMLEVTNVDEGQRVLRDSGLNCTVANGMKNAAEKVVALAN
jgi:succinyl-CoA synthetase beta subunit